MVGFKITGRTMNIWYMLRFQVINVRFTPMLAPERGLFFISCRVLTLVRG